VNRISGHSACGASLMSGIYHVVFANMSLPLINGHNSRDHYKGTIYVFRYTSVESTLRRLVGLENFCGSADSAYQPARRRFYRAAKNQRKLSICVCDDDEVDQSKQ
jgi:hypothetical protein